MAIDPARVKALFQAAIELDDPVERRALLSREAGDDSELRGRLDALLEAHDRPPGPLDRPLGDGLQATIGAEPDAIRDAPAPAPCPTAADGPDPVRHGGESHPPLDSVIAGRYKLRQEIGEGGMGTVYLAEQTAPVRRLVALKLIKPGMDSRTVLARFESERQALALMDHPNIAKVLDAGTTEQGRPFFVMELVKGIPLTEYCDRHQLGISERLGLFRQICSAVQHAHQKGIIHRDLKPTNILVESHDGRPVPKVIDFGLAKATSGMRLSEHSLFTAFGSVAGTPLYMAPEQAAFNALDVDTRADIYALGVILYELLSGSTPIQKDTLKRAALDEMLRVIREVEPPTPSSRISTSEGLPSIAASRHVEPARLSRLVRGDLDWIVMKALAKERERRYDSAIGLGNDVERFLAHEPVSAGPPTAAYRLRKFVRRNRVQVAAAALVLLALVVGVAGTTLGLLEARRQAKRAWDQESIARAEAEAKEVARSQAEARLGQVTKMNEILGSIFQDLDPVNAVKDGKPLAAILGERLDRANAEIEGEAIGDPLAVARIQTILGHSQRGLGYPAKAAALFTKARATRAARLGPDHPDTIASLHNLAASYYEVGRNDEALRLGEEALARAKATLGPDHPVTIWSMDGLANTYCDAGRNDEALKLREAVLALRRAKFGPDHLETILSQHNLAVSYDVAGRHDEALRLREEALARRKATLGPDHRDTIWSMAALADSYADAGRRDEALRLHEEALARRKATLGPDHPDTIWSMQRLASSYREAGRFEEALGLREEALARAKARLGQDSPNLTWSLSALAASYADVGRRDEALRLREEALARLRAKFGPDHPDTIGCQVALARALQDAGYYDRAEPLWDDLAVTRRKAGGDGDLAARLDRADLDLVRGRLDDAERALRALLEECRARLGPNHNNTLWAAGSLAQVLEKRGDPAAAALLSRAVVDGARASGNGDWLRQGLRDLGLARLALKEWAEAEAAAREALALEEATMPDGWSTHNARSILGAALLGQGKAAEAGPLLRSGYEGLMKRRAAIPAFFKPCLAAALDRLIAFGEATGKADEVKTWKAERAKLGAPAPKPEADKK